MENSVLDGGNKNLAGRDAVLSQAAHNGNPVAVRRPDAGVGEDASARAAGDFLSAGRSVVRRTVE